ncbi:MAG: DUF1934 domain-containing protein [Ruminococcaceae bacterium]|nr:DUF1934 domain-containing protein [Oscillospiraceae bacterium]
MESNVWIKLRGSQEIEGEEDSYELITEGTYKKENGKYIVSYEGSEITGYENTTTTLSVEKDNVSMLRTGALTPTQMIFEKGNKYTGQYETPFGFLYVGVTTNDMTVNVGEEGGNIELDYYVQFNDNDPVKNALSVEITKKED